MMKDQFANYVVQKVLEVSNDRQRELLLDRVRVHLNALKKYTYGKHIAARFEQLLGEGWFMLDCSMQKAMPQPQGISSLSSMRDLGKLLIILREDNSLELFQAC
ncbi:hypothetical protein Golob_026276 [Gossypium lobatum]|uniref:PUM-HD domain-containing protein n=1 Tax=Gossypium lobatum TaxID=34289 RepID=A0A7J8LUM9_9ROSI|nr:hypothetical protein [Gossypium lobatum]